MTDERKLLLLGLLRQTEMHGYVLNAHLQGMVPISLKKPTAYNLLERMEQDGWVDHREEFTGDRSRKVYSVTESGERAFARLLREQLGTYIHPELPGLVSMRFSDDLDASEALDLLSKRRAELSEYRASLISDGESHGDELHSGSSYHVIEYVRRLADLEARFLDEVIKGLESNI